MSSSKKAKRSKNNGTVKNAAVTRQPQAPDFGWSESSFGLRAACVDEQVWGEWLSLGDSDTLGAWAANAMAPAGGVRLVRRRGLCLAVGPHGGFLFRVALRFGVRLVVQLHHLCGKMTAGNLGNRWSTMRKSVLR